jgi:hypothetical protein
MPLDRDGEERQLTHARVRASAASQRIIMAGSFARVD